MAKCKMAGCGPGNQIPGCSVSDFLSELSSLSCDVIIAAVKLGQAGNSCQKSTNIQHIFHYKVLFLDKTLVSLRKSKWALVNLPNNNNLVIIQWIFKQLTNEKLSFSICTTQKLFVQSHLPISLLRANG